MLSRAPARNHVSCGWKELLTRLAISTPHSYAAASRSSRALCPHSFCPSLLQIIVADRSPLSGVLYARSDGALLEPLIRQYVAELRAVANVHILSVHLTTRRELLWARICTRLLAEPSRAALREDRREWMDAVCDLYASLRWDCIVDNDEAPVATLAASVLLAAAGTHADVRAAVLAAHALMPAGWSERVGLSATAPVVTAGRDAAELSFAFNKNSAPAGAAAALSAACGVATPARKGGAKTTSHADAGTPPDPSGGDSAGSADSDPSPLGSSPPQLPLHGHEMAPVTVTVTASP